MRNLILGAGFAGLAAGIKTGFPIYEATNKSGGICGSYDKEGFTFSSGGPHWIFEKGSGFEYIKRFTGMLGYERKSSVYINKCFPYPIQTFAQTQHETEEGTFKRWLADRFSPELCNMFFYPFNDKYTCGLYAQTEQLDAYKTPKKGGTGTCTKFYDPMCGLNGVIEHMEKQCDIKYNKEVFFVDTKLKVIFFKDGTNEKYDRLISTIPLNKMMDMCGKSIDLPYTSVLVINIGANKGINTPKDHWVYVPFSKSGMHRVAFYSNVSKDKAPNGKVGLSVEIAYRRKLSEEEIKDIERSVIDELKEWGFIGDVIVSDPTWVECAYSWVYKDKDRTDAIAWLKSKGIECAGRYATWKFQGMIRSMEQGFEVEK